VRHYRFLSAVAGRPLAPEAPVIPWRDRPAPGQPAPPYLVLNAGSNEPGRRWPFAGYRAIAARALAQGFRIALVGSAAERPPSAELALLERDPRVVNLIGRTSLAELIDVMKGAAAVLSNDTGPAHLAIAIGAPTVVVVGGGHFGSFVPYPEGVRPATARFVHHAMECYHCFWRCHKRQRKTETFPCVAGVSEDDVWQALIALAPALAGGAKAAPAGAAGR
jgi:ADP-heptose:LPS heptosyltransferase